MEQEEHASSSEDEHVLSDVENFATVVPYQFEPTAAPKTACSMSQPKQSKIDRLGNTAWLELFYVQNKLFSTYCFSN